jgi:hypothetical protein
LQLGKFLTTSSSYSMISSFGGTQLLPSHSWYLFILHQTSSLSGSLKINFQQEVNYKLHAFWLSFLSPSLPYGMLSISSGYIKEILYTLDGEDQVSTKSSKRNSTSSYVFLILPFV